MAHITANDLKTRGIAAIEATLAESQADIAAGRFVVESPARRWVGWAGLAGPAKAQPRPCSG